MSVASRRVAPYGTWSSPVGIETVTAMGTLATGPGELLSTPAGLVALRDHPDGRAELVRHLPDGAVEALIPAGFSAHTLVHEYGGGSWWPSGEDVIFCNFEDQRVYRARPGVAPVALTPAPPAPRALRYADGVAAPGGEWSIAVRESHGGAEAVDELVRIDHAGERPVVPIVSGADFYASPRISADGTRLCWIQWSHPVMPWEESELWVADLTPAGEVAGARRVAGGGGDGAPSAVSGPVWAPDGTLYCVWDRTGWQRIHRAGEPEPVCEAEADFGAPLWWLGRETLALLDDGRIACLYTVDGDHRLGVVDPGSGELTALPTEFTMLRGPLRASGDRVFLIGASPDRSAQIVAIDVRSGADVSPPAQGTVRLPDGYVSRPRPIVFPGHAGELAHALYYLPVNRDFEGPPDALPPLLVRAHGGPTFESRPGQEPSIQFWTSRGFAVVDVQYSGSIGYGRAYRERLRGAWGVADVADCVGAARHLVAQGLVDGERLGIAGRSAGGWAVLCALIFHDVFHAGACTCSPTDLEAFVRTTHKLEANYIARLVGADVRGPVAYEERSPARHVERITAPLLLLQGEEDHIVPLSEAEELVERLRAHGVPHTYVSFPGEGHGFRSAAALQRALREEQTLFERAFGLHGGA